MQLPEQSERQDVGKNSIIVLGASGGVGRVIVNELIQTGHHVVAVARNRERLALLEQRIARPEKLLIVPGSVATEPQAAELARTLRGLRRKFAAVVAVLKAPYESARLLDRPASFLTRTLDENFLTHFIAAKYILPLLAESRPEGLYLMLGGPAADRIWAGYGHLSVASAALRALAQVLREEAKELPVFVQQLQIGTPVRTEENCHCACEEWMGADEVARTVVSLVDERRNGEPVVRIGSYIKPAPQPVPTN